MPRGRAMMIGSALVLGASSLCAGGGEATVCATSIALADLGESSVDLFVDAPEGSTVTGVTVSVRATHGWIGDVVVFIEHGGILLRLVDRPGVGSFTFGCGGEALDVLVTDTPVGGAAPCTPENPRFVGEVAPLDALSFYDGVGVDGVWRVTFRDVHQFDAGTVEEVCVNVTYETPVVCAGDCDGSGEVDFNDLVAMLFEFGSEPVMPACDADGSGGVDFNDLVSALFVFGVCDG